jgi:NAD(P) transhydrogenase subunit alpha
VQAYDVRPAVREQVESLGAKFVELSMDAAQSEDKGGYAKQLSEEFYQHQREVMAKIVADSDMVITTAAIPGKKSPLLITKQAVEGMRAGSVIIDLAAERGGNCELSQPDQRVEHHGVVILGPTNLASEIPHDASQMYAKNISTFLLNSVRDGQLHLDTNDEVVSETLVAHQGQVPHARLRQALGLEPLTPSPSETASADASSTPVQESSR